MTSKKIDKWYENMKMGLIVYTDNDKDRLIHEYLTIQSMIDQTKKEMPSQWEDMIKYYNDLQDMINEVLNEYHNITIGIVSLEDNDRIPHIYT